MTVDEMRKSLAAVLRATTIAIATFLAAPAGAQTSIDNTCATCSRRALDSANLRIGAVRVNQVGYRTDDPVKRAIVGEPRATTFQVLRANGTVALTGPVKDLGVLPYRGNMLIRGYYNSITPMYTFGDSAGAVNERLGEIEFGSLTEEGTFRVAVGPDTSAPFDIRKTIYNDVFETSLKFFGAQRCGATNSWFHKDCHVKDGSAAGAEHAGALHGGWHDCGDHGKYGETVGYAAIMLAMAYATLPEKAEDRYGASYDDTIPFGNDGVPDLLWEAKIGADYIYRLYTLSKARGLIARRDMFHSVGSGPGMDHNYWDVPENQDAQPQNRGGPNRPITAGIGGNVAGMFATNLALVGWAWEPFDPDYSRKLIAAAREIYDSIVIPKRNATTSNPCCYTGGGQLYDDPALAAVALWFATGEKRFGYDLLENKAFYNNPTAIFNDGEFPAGLMGKVPFHHGGWTTDYQQVNALALYGLGKLILRDSAQAAKFGVAKTVRDSLMEDVLVCLRSSISIGSNGANRTRFPGIGVDLPFHGVFTSADWGFNRYNMGLVGELLMYWDLARNEPAFQANAHYYRRVGTDNLDYQLGVNPWEMSFIMGAGRRNLQHPHNRAANPEGYNAGGIPYEYKVPKGALMGGCKPGAVLKDYWEDFTVTETCIDFSSQLIFPAQLLAEDLPPDHEGPKFFNVVVQQVTNTSAIVTWETDELSRDTLFYALTPGGPILGYIVADLGKKKGATITGLQPATQYHFYFKGMDIYRNVSTEDNKGQWFPLRTTTDPLPPPEVLGIRVCNVTHEQATVYWWTKNGPYSSGVEFSADSTFRTGRTLVDRDDEGIPARFHKVTLKGLKPATTYWFDVLSGGVRDDNGGRHRSFRTTEVLVDYTVRIKPTVKGRGTAHFYVEVANNEQKPYYGLELRLYFNSDATTAAGIVAKGFDNQLFTVDNPRPLAIDYGAAQPVQGKPGQFYLPITIKDTLPVAGRARIELQLNAGTGGWGPFAFSNFAGAWSLAAKNSPVAFPGVDLAKLWDGPEAVEGRPPAITYVNTPYITAHYNGVHVYGYPPDWQTNKPKSHKSVNLLFEKPRPSPATSLAQDSFSTVFAGRGWARPDANITHLEMNAEVQPITRIGGRPDSVSFGYPVAPLPYAASSWEFALWHNRDSLDCACDWKRWTITVDTVKAPPEKRFLVLRGAPPVRDYVGQRIAVSVVLSSDSTDTVAASAVVALAATKPGIQFFPLATGGAPVTSIPLAGGVATVWISSSAPVDSATITAAATLPGAVVAPGVLFPVTFAVRPPWPLADSARIVDADCDGRGDSVRVFLDAPLAAEHRLAGAAVSWGTGSAEVAAPSLVAAGAVVSVALPAGFPDTTAPVADVVLRIRVVAGGDTTVAISVRALDRIGPRLVAASILENFATGATPDTVRVLFSEPVILPASGWPFVVTRAGAPVAPGLTVLSVREVGPDLYEYALQGNAAGGTLLRASDVLRLVPAAGIRDSAGNVPAGCGDSVLLAQRVKPVPMLAGWIDDSDGDGRADRAVVRFARALRDVDLPDTLRLAWGAGEEITIPRATLSAGSADVVIPIVPTWSATQGAGAAGQGQATFIQASGAAGRRESMALADSVGPVLRTAIVRYGRAGLPDTLVLRLSEPVSLAATGPELDRFQGVSTVARGRSVGALPDVWRLVVDSSDPGYPRVGDSVRLPVPGPWSDARTNLAGALNPWVVVRGGDRPPEKAWAEDSDADGRVDRLHLRMAREPSTGTTFDMAWPDSAGAGLDLRHIGRWTWDAGSRTAILVPEEPFDLGATSTDPLRWPWLGAMNVDLDGVQDTLPFAVEDSADPVVLDAVVRYGTEDGDRDTLVARFSETVIFVAAPPVVLHRRGAVPEEPVAQLDVLQSPDGRSALIFLGPGTTSFRRNDSVRIAPFSTGSVRDLLGNAAEEPGFWVPVRFGTRKARFRIAMHPASLIERPSTAPEGSPAVEVLVRPRGETRWTYLDGTAADGTWRIGPRIETNVPLAGSIHIYDRMGVFVASIDLAELARAVYGERVPVDPAGRYEFWIAWNGRSASGRAAASGVYYARLLLQEAPEGEPGPTWINRVVNFGITTR